MSHPKILNWTALFLFAGLLTACNASDEPAQPPQLPEAGSQDEVLFQQRCHECHMPPLPRNHAAADWPGIVERMQSHRLTTGMQPLSGEELRRINAYLQRNAKDAT